jgi:hypothetical protein
MRVVQKVLFVVLISSLMAAQSSPTSGSDTPKTEGDVQKLLDAVAAQQKAIAEQQKQIEEQQVEIERLKQQFATQSHAVSTSSDSQSARVVDATLTAPNTNPAARTVSDSAAQELPKESPLSFRIGGAEFTPGGFMDFTSIFRSVNTGSATGTSFGGIPFSNTVGGHLTENRFSAQNSRISLKATDKFGKNDVTGYVEMDFLGNDASNAFVTSNSHTLRQRLYFVDVKRDKWEILAGQAWSWLTPNRAGLSPYPADIFYSQDMDFNYQVGLTWTRAPQVRVAYHPNDNWAFGVALEDPEQYTNNEVTFPNSFTAQLGTQVDANSSPNPAAAGDGNGTPNLHPDIIPKITYDTNMAGKHFHVEAAGLLTGIRVANIPTVTGATFVKHTKEGAGVEAAINLEVVKNFRLVANGFYSDGGGRYIFGLAPDMAFAPVNAPGQTCTNVATGTPPGPVTFSGAGCDVAISLVHSGSGIFGFETQVTPRTMFYGYYGGMYAQRDFFADPTGKPGTFVGFGGPNSSNSNNRAIQEGTLGWIQTFWRNPQYGALQLITQASYLTRAPWFVAAGAPKNAHLAMGWVDIRYILP